MPTMTDPSLTSRERRDWLHDYDHDRRHHRTVAQ
jgi:hypothetical protein